MNPNNLKPWYKFHVQINYFEPEKSQIIFPEDPFIEPETGKFINNYLELSGFFRQENILSDIDSKNNTEVIYFAKNQNAQVERLVKLYLKFSSKGATLKEIKEKNDLAEEVKELKKLYYSNQKKLESLKAEYQQLEIELQQEN